LPSSVSWPGHNTYRPKDEERCAAMTREARTGGPVKLQREGGGAGLLGEFHVKH